MSRLISVVFFVFLFNSPVFSAPANSVAPEPFLDSPLTATPGQIEAENRISTPTIFDEIWSHIERNFHPGGIDRDECFRKILQGGIAYCTGDPHTAYLNPQGHKEFNQETIGGTIGGGIGAGLEIKPKESLPTIGKVLPNTPAAKVGLQVGDVLIAISTQTATVKWINFKGLALTEIVQMIRGKPGTKILLKYFREGEKKEVEITREIIKIEFLISKEIGNIGYLKITEFGGGRNTAKQFEQIVSGFQKKNIKSLIIDLRNNPGGLLALAIDICRYFRNPPTVVYEQFRGQEPKRADFGVKESLVCFFWKTFVLVFLSSIVSNSRG